MMSLKLNNKTPSYIPEKKNISEIFQSNLGTGIESVSPGDKVIECHCHPLVGAVQTSFNCHLPLRLSPDGVWITLTKGLADHINKTPEEFRSKFVNFDGKQTISVAVDHFIKGQQNDWSYAFDKFSSYIKDYIGEENHKLIVSDFSTTDLLRKSISEVVLMDAMQSYFNYRCTTRCGIPEVILEGTVEDWESIRDRFASFRQFNMDWWVDALSPILDEIVKTAKGEQNIEFWNNFYSKGGGSGGPYISGHIVKFYPYTGKDKIKNSFEKRDPRISMMHGKYTSNSFPYNWSMVPFVWTYFGTEYAMEFIAGMVGLKLGEDNSVTPEFAWAVREASIPLSSYAAESLYVGMEIFDKDGNKGVLKNAQIDTREWGGKEHKKVDWYLIDFNGVELKLEPFKINGYYTKGMNK